MWLRYISVTKRIQRELIAILEIEISMCLVQTPATRAELTANRTYWYVH